MRKTSSHKPIHGFTLIELLVVIAIIAMLLAILMPALSAVREQARSVVCMTQLSQWGLILTLYTEDHNGRFFAGFYNYTDPNDVTFRSNLSDLWPYALQPYYQTPRLKFCPSASGFSRRSSRSIWGSESDDILSGSYGLNGWLGDTPQEVKFTEGRDTQNSWRTMNYAGASNIPMMADALWFTGRPESHDLPPEHKGQIGREDIQSAFNDPCLPCLPGMPGVLPESTPILTEDWWDIDTSNQMQRFYVDRHRNKINVLFMDGTIKNIRPWQLWQLKWHKHYDTSISISISEGP